MTATATGSAYGEFPGSARVLVSVFGPRPRSIDESTCLSTRVHLPFCKKKKKKGTKGGGEGGGGGREEGKEERALEMALEAALLPSIKDDGLEKTTVEIQCTLLESLDSCHPADKALGPMILVSSIALASSSIPLLDLVTFAELGSIKLAYMPSRDQLTYLAGYEGDWTGESLAGTMQVLVDGCKKIHPIMRKCLIDNARS